MNEVEKIKILCQEKLNVSESFKAENISYMQGVTDTCKDILKVIENNEVTK